MVNEIATPSSFMRNPNVTNAVLFLPILSSLSFLYYFVATGALCKIAGYVSLPFTNVSGLNTKDYQVEKHKGSLHIYCVT